MDKIRKGNFKGLNLSGCKITLLGQISLADQSISNCILDAKEEKDPVQRTRLEAKINEMEKTVAEL